MTSMLNLKVKTASMDYSVYIHTYKLLRWKGKGVKTKIFRSIKNPEKGCSGSTHPKVNICWAYHSRWNFCLMKTSKLNYSLFIFLFTLFHVLSPKVIWASHSPSPKKTFLTSSGASTECTATMSILFTSHWVVESLQQSSLSLIWEWLKGTNSKNS